MMPSTSPVFGPYRYPLRIPYDERVYGDCWSPNMPYGFYPNPVWFEYPPLHNPGYMWAINQRAFGIPVGALRDFSMNRKSDKVYEKPSLSYVGLIAEAIFSSPEKKLVLSDIYAFIVQNYPYFNTKGNGWRNSIRHNLSLNDCFVKGERSPNGKGHFWQVNPLCYEELYNGTAKPRPKKRALKSTGMSNETLSSVKEELRDNGENKLELLSHLKFEDEIRQFEAASKKLMVNETPSTKNDLSHVENS